jgi:hypothetical protein
VEDRAILRVACWAALIVAVATCIPLAIFALRVVTDLVRRTRGLFHRPTRAFGDVGYHDVLLSGQLLVSSQALNKEDSPSLLQEGGLSSVQRRLLMAPLHNEACVLWSATITRTFLPVFVGDVIGRAVPMRLVAAGAECELRIEHPRAPAILLPHDKFEFAETDPVDRLMIPIRRELPDYRPREGPNNMFREVRVRPGGECVVFGTPARIERPANEPPLIAFDQAVVYPGSLGRVRMQVALRASILLALIGAFSGGGATFMAWMAVMTYRSGLLF